MSIFLTLIGAAMIIVALLDVFQTLFHPAAHGALSDWTAHAIWKIFRMGAERWRGLLTFAGPVAFVLTILVWTSLVTCGFGFIYWARMGTDFSFPAGLDPHQYSGYMGGLDTSLEALITLTEGPSARVPVLGLFRGIQAVIGFGLLTASVSWLLSLYPVLETRRSLAHQANLLHAAEQITGIDMIQQSPEQAEQSLFNLAALLTTLRNEMAQFPISYYFHIGEKETSLSGILPYVAHLADRANQQQASPGLRIAGAALGGAVVDFTKLLARRFLDVGQDNQAAILRAYAQAHMYEPVELDNFTRSESGTDRAA